MVYRQVQKDTQISEGRLPFGNAAGPVLATLVFRADGVNVFAHFFPNHSRHPFLVCIRLPATIQHQENRHQRRNTQLPRLGELSFGQKSLNHRNLALSRRSVQTECMRRPQPIIESLHIRTVHFLTIGIVIALLGMFPMNAGANTQQLTASPSNLAFGWMIVGQTKTLMVTLTNNGQTSVTVSGIAASNSQFTVSNSGQPLVLPAGQSVEVSVSFTAPSGLAIGTVQFSSNASNPTFVLNVRGGGTSSVSLNASPSTVPFGSVAIGASSTVPVVLTNDRPFNLTLYSASTTGRGFSVSGASFPLTLNPGQSVTLNVSFAPQAAGTVGGSLYVTSVSLTVPLTGTGGGTTTAVGSLTLSPTLVNFGNVKAGATETMPMTISATGASVTVSSASSSSPQFALQGLSFPMTLASGQSLSFNVAFTPQNSGTVNGSLTFASNASDSQALASVTGSSSTVTPSSVVNLSWNYSSGAAGYNIYRSTAANGTFSKINSPLDTATAYTDSTVVSGQTYYYAATSVNSSGQESTRSAPVEVVIP